MSVTDDYLLALRLRALGHPARLAIIRALAIAERCQCGEIVKVLPLAQSTVSQHLKILKEAGLIAGTIEGPRSCYCLDKNNLASLGDEFIALMRLAGLAPRNPATQERGLDQGASAPICTSREQDDGILAPLVSDR